MRFIYAFLLSLFLVSCSLMQPKSAGRSTLTEKEISAITNLIGKEKIAKDVYENFYEQYKINLFGNIAKRKQKHIEIWKDILRKQNIAVLEYDELVETEALKNQLISEGIDEISAFKTALKIEELNLNDIAIVKKYSKHQEVSEVAKGIECGTKNHFFVYHKALRDKGEKYRPLYISGKQFIVIVNGAVNSCSLKYD